MHQLDGGCFLTTGRYHSAADFPTHLHLAIARLLHLLHIYRTNCVITKACDHRSRRWNTGLGRPDFEAIFWEWKGEPTTSSGWVQHNFLSETFKVARKFNWKASAAVFSSSYITIHGNHPWEHLKCGSVVDVVAAGEASVRNQHAGTLISNDSGYHVNTFLFSDSGTILGIFFEV